MAGHSKWSKVKRMKGALDSKRGMLFSKLSKEITIATRMGGGNPSLNHRLRAAVQSARSQSMPNENIEIILDVGAEEIESDDSHHNITTPPDKLYAVSEALRGAGIEPDSQKLTFIPEIMVGVTEEAIADQVLKLCDSLEDNDDVLNVHSNFDISEDLLAAVHGGHN